MVVIVNSSSRKLTFTRACNGVAPAAATVAPKDYTWVFAGNPPSARRTRPRSRPTRATGARRRSAVRWRSGTSTRSTGTMRPGLGHQERARAPGPPTATDPPPHPALNEKGPAEPVPFSTPAFVGSRTEDRAEQPGQAGFAFAAIGATPVDLDLPIGRAAPGSPAAILLRRRPLTGTEATILSWSCMLDLVRQSRPMGLRPPKGRCAAGRRGSLEIAHTSAMRR